MRLENRHTYIGETDSLPALYATEATAAEDKFIHVKLYLPGTDTAWYLAEYDAAEELAFGYAVLNGDLMMAEWGYISLREIADLQLPWSAARVERDKRWTAVRFGDIDLETGQPYKHLWPLSPPRDGDSFKLRDLVMGMAVHAPRLIVDEENETIVTLQMMGVPQAVNANWAALMGGGKQHYILNALVKLRGAKNHIRLQKMLPETGWKELWLIHKQASYNELDAGQPYFYLMQSVTESYPPNFMAMLDKAIPVPVQPTWAAYLFRRGRAENLIRPLPARQCVGWWGYKVIIAGWAEVIAAGIAEGALTF